jgi:hypothetical protein
MTRDECGAALVAVVLITLALFAIGHGLLGLSLGELAASRAAVRLVESNAAAESAVKLELRAPGASWLDSVAVGGERAVLTRSFGRAEGSAVVWRLSAESWWVEGTGSVGTAEARTARLAWALDPLTRILALPGAVTVAVSAPVELAGSVEMGRLTVVDPPMDPTDCPWMTQLDAHYALEPLFPVAALTADTLPSLGVLGFPELLDAVDVLVGGTVSPSPVEALGTCVVMEPSNWGDPDRPWRPCAAHLALRKSLGSLRVIGGTGQGVLVVDGDLVLDEGARFHGLVLARGALRVEGGAELVGMAVATGGAHIGPGGGVRASACWATRALAANRSRLGRMRPIPGQAVLGPL